MTFTHLPPLPEVKLERFEIDGRRHYATPTGKKYPSITTVLSADPAKRKMLAEWKNRVGKEEAQKVSSRASSRGTSLHDTLERYIKNELDEAQLDPFTKMRLNDFKPALSSVHDVVLQEKFLFSDRLRIAGTPDLICKFATMQTDDLGDWDSKQQVPWNSHELTVVDFKTSSKPKRREWISDYFKQSSFYALAMFEKYQIEIKQVAILISVEGESKPQIFTERVKNWIVPLIEARDNYERMYP